MGEISCRIAVEGDALDSKFLQKAGHYDTSDGVDCVENDLEAGFSYCLGIYSLEIQD